MSVARVRWGKTLNLIYVNETQNNERNERYSIDKFKIYEKQAVIQKRQKLISSYSLRGR